MPRAATAELLYEVLRDHLETFLDRAQADGRRLPAFVGAEVRGFLRCGVHAYGFNRVRCSACRHEFAVPFSCKGRGYCPSCCGRHMASTAAHLVDHVLPDVPYRQWVLTLPFELRLAVAYDPSLCGDLLRVYARELRRWASDRARELGLSSPLWGGFTVIQRFGSDLRLNPHFHTLTPDGVFARVDTGNGTASVEFVRLPAPTTAEVGAIVDRVRRSAARLLRRRGMLDENNELSVRLADDEGTLERCYDGAVSGRAAFGARAGQRAARVGRILSTAPPEELGSRCARSQGFNLHANTTVRSGDRDGLERLCRYLTRPPLSHDRLERLDDEFVGLQLKTPYSDGTTHIALSYFELIERLCALVPRPGTHRVRYHGVFASASPHRGLVVPTPPAVGDACEGSCSDSRPMESDNAPSQDEQETGEPTLRQKRRRIRRLLWAGLLKRTFGVDPKECPNCGGRMKMIATIMRAEVVTAILGTQGLPTDAPFIRPCRGPPDGELFEVWWT